ncbi:MAG TPA: redox-sensing transcriptional repressor Rex, partial [Clostridiales bacterium]|nr:redox-sensing transcriptional repressor Rex [Clostridiales bacterium]
AASGQLVNGIPIRHISGLDDFCLENKPVIAVLCVPKERARELTENLIRLGIKGFWNFTHFDIGNQFPQIAVENVHLSDSLMTLCYKLDRLGDKK